MLLQRPQRVDERGRRDRGTDAGSLRAWEIKRERALLSGERTYPIVRLTEDGIDWGVMPEAGDEVGYGMHPYLTDDCLPAAIATATQVPIEQAPDLGLQRRVNRGEDPDEIASSSWEKIDRWAAKRGLALTFWDEVPVPRHRWIGVVRGSAGAVYDPITGRVDDDGYPFNDHCLVMSGDQLVFDPSCSVRPPPGMRTMEYEANQIVYGISFDNEEE